MTDEEMLSLWRQALKEPNGLGISTDKPRSLSALLYRLRDRIDEPELDQLVVVLPKDREDEVWIVRKDVRQG